MDPGRGIFHETADDKLINSQDNLEWAEVDDQDLFDDLFSSASGTTDSERNTPWEDHREEVPTAATEQHDSLERREVF